MHSLSLSWERNRYYGHREKDDTRYKELIKFDDATKYLKILELVVLFNTGIGNK